MKNKNALEILIIDDNEQFCESLSILMSGKGFTVFLSYSSRQAFALLKEHAIRLILLDVRLGDESGSDVLIKLKAKYPSIPVVMLTGFGTIESAVNSIKLGAYDYIQKPVQFLKLHDVIRNALNKKSVNKIASNDNSILSHDKKTIEILQTLDKLSPTNIPILIHGENGTGKEMFAEYIQSHSNRKEKEFIKINCASFSDTLLDNELFGHDKGAYTGADSVYRGVFEKADEGTLFLDEIGDMPLNVQSKVLRVLQNKELFRLGGEKIIKVDIRIIAATNKNLEQLISEHKFRQDLYYRLNAALITIPPLCERREDIPSLADFFIECFALENQKTIRSVSPEVLDILHNHNWPGNIRELKNLLSYAVAVSKNSTVEIEDLPLNFLNKHRSTDSVNLLEQSERTILLEELKRCNFNKKRVAETLNMSRGTLYSKLKKYEITT